MAADAGILAGKIELEDATTPTLASISGKIDALSAKFDDMGGHVRKAKEEQDGLAKSLEGVAGRFEKLGERVAEYFAIREVVRFAKEIGENALALNNLSIQTNVSLHDLQVLGVATREYGVDMNELSRGIFQLSQKIAGGDQSVATALHMMGMGLNEVAGLQGKELFLKIESGLAQLTGTAREAASADLFGSKLGGAMLAFAKDADEALDKAEALGNYIDDKAVKQWADFQRSLELAEKNLQSIATKTLAPVASGFNDLYESVARFGILKTVTGWWGDLDSLVLGSSPIFNTTAMNLGKLHAELDKGKASAEGAAGAHREAAEALTEEGQAARFMASLEADSAKTLEEWQLKDLAHLKEIGELNAKNAAAIGVNVVQFNKYQQAMKETEATQKKYKEGMQEIATVGVTWEKTLNGISGEVVESVKYYLQAGVALDKLAAIYALNDAQAKAIQADLKAEGEGRKMLIGLTEGQAKAEADLAKVRLDGRQRSLAQELKDDLASAAARLERGLINETQYQNAVLGIKSTYAQRSEDVYRQSAEIEVKAAEEATAKQLAVLEQSYTEGKVSTEDYEKAKTIITATGEAQRRAIREQYDNDRKDRVAAEIADAKNVGNEIEGVGGKIRMLDHAWVTDGDLAAASVSKVTLMVKNLAGEIMTVAEAYKRLHSGSSMTYDLSTREGMNQFHQLNPAASSSWSDAQIMEFVKKGGTLEQLVKQGIINLYAGYAPVVGQMPHLSEGGVGNFGSGTQAMLHGKEAIIPLDKAGILGKGMNVTIYVNGTAAEAARKISDELMKVASAQRLFGTS